MEMFKYRSSGGLSLGIHNWTQNPISTSINLTSSSRSILGFIFVRVVCSLMSAPDSKLLSVTLFFNCDHLSFARVACFEFVFYCRSISFHHTAFSAHLIYQSFLNLVLSSERVLFSFLRGVEFVFVTGLCYQTAT